MAESRRSIVREHLFEESLAALISDATQGDEFVASAEEVLSWEPQLGTPREDGVWVLPMSPIGGADVWLFYTFDETTVTFLFIGAF